MGRERLGYGIVAQRTLLVRASNWKLAIFSMPLIDLFTFCLRSDFLLTFCYNSASTFWFLDWRQQVQQRVCDFSKETPRRSGLLLDRDRRGLLSRTWHTIQKPRIRLLPISFCIWAVERLWHQYFSAEIPLIAEWLWGVFVLEVMKWNLIW